MKFTSTNLSCFKKYDVRGILGENLDSEICYRIGRSFAKFLSAKRVILGYDARISSPELANGVAEALLDSGVEVLEIGLSGTEEMYWATSHFGACGGMQITASHNPSNYNGIKMVKAKSTPLCAREDIPKIRMFAEENSFGKMAVRGKRLDIMKIARDAYVNKVLSFLNYENINPLKIVIDSGNGAAGPTFDALVKGISKESKMLTFDRIRHMPDGSFPEGVPNPLIPENQMRTSERVLEVNADFGVAFDGDFDRCFFFDEKGKFVSGEYVVGLFAEMFLRKEGGGNIIHDPRVIWNIRDIVQTNGGKPIVSKTGHTFIKESMRKYNAVYGGELSSHHYFRDFAFCDSGMIPWILILQILSTGDKKFSELVEDRIKMFPSSGERNYMLDNPEVSIRRVKDFYNAQVIEKDDLDGISLLLENWRLNIRSSNTEQLVRVNIESKTGTSLINEKLKEIENIFQYT